MAAEVEGEGGGGIFEITDFTNATPWESFIADLEGLFRQWELAKPDLIHEARYGGAQHRKTERISYSGREFVITLEVERGHSRREGEHSEDDVAEWPAALYEMRDNTRDFPPKAHHLARWYGLSQFVVVCPTEGGESLHSQAQANLMTSSVSIAITNTGCTTPVFVQLHLPWRQVYVGMCQGGRVRVDFSVTHLRHTPAQFNHLSGLLDVFKSKLGSVSKMDPVQVAIRFLYVLRHWSLDDWPVEPLGDVDKGFDGDYLNTHRVGAFSDPVKELHLSTIWPKLTEELVTDTGTYSDLNPNHASVWTVRLHLTENASCMLAETLLNFYQLCYRNGSVAEMLGKTSLWDDEATGTMSDSYSKPLDRLTSPGSTLASPLFHSVVYTATQRMDSGRSPEENITEKDMEAVVKFLFPDAYQSNYTSDPPEQGNSGLVHKLKSAPLNSMTSRLARALAIVNTECGVKAMCKVWHEVSLELRYRWENGITLPNISEGPPNMNCSLLHQKLQMLNCCIRHKLQHQTKSNSSSNKSQSTRPPLARPLSIPSARRNAEKERSSRLNKAGHESSRKLEVTADTSGIVGVSEEEGKGGRVIGTSGEGEGGEDRKKSMETKMELRPTSESSDDEFYEAQETHEEDDRDGESAEGESSSPAHAAEEEREEEKDSEPKKKLQTENGGPQSTCTSASAGATLNVQSESGISDEGGEQADDVGSSGSVPGDSGDGGRSDGGGGGGDDGRLGRLRPCGDLVLVTTGEPMYIPVTQDHAPLTEDHVWEHQAVMAKLGTSEEAARLRAKMQSSSLMSDMQAFKAANPGCRLEDFVRWYSPRDWEEGEEEEEEEEEGEESMETEEIGKREDEGSSEATMEVDSNTGQKTDGKSKFDVHGGEGGEGEGWGEEGEGWGGEWDVVDTGVEGREEEGEGKGGPMEAVAEETEEVLKQEEPSKKRFVCGRLSVRMRQPHNLWREVWSVAEALPVHRQKKLFDDTREAEKVLHYLAGLKTAELGLLVLPVLVHSAIQALQDKHGQYPLSSSESHLHDAISLLASIPHPSLDCLPKYQEVISLLSQTEHLQAAAYSLRLKLAQGLDVIEATPAVGDRRRDSELTASVEVLLQEPELVLQDPTSSLTGMALQGLLAAQVASRDLEEQDSSRKKIRVSTETFPPPSGREFILRSTLPRPTPHSLPSPQRMYCVLTPAEFRLAGAFATDILIT